MIDASPPDLGDEKLESPLVSIRPGIVARSGGEIHVPPYVRREIQGDSEWPGSMARVSQPQVAAMATITGVGR